MHEYVQWQAAIKIMCIMLRENKQGEETMYSSYVAQGQKVFRY